MQCAWSALLLECFPLDGGWSSSSRATKIIKRVLILIFLQSTMSVLVIVFTYLEGWDVEIVINELAAVDFHSDRVSSYVFNRPMAGRKYQCLTPEWIKKLTTGIIGMLLIYYILSCIMWYIARHHLVLQSIASGPRKHNLSAVFLSIHLFISLR